MGSGQIAAVACINVPEEGLQSHKVAYYNCFTIFDGNNLQTFFIGPQIFVTYIMFIVAKIATISIPAGEVPKGFQSFLDTGLLGAIVLTIIGSFAWRIIALSFPLAFMSKPVITSLVLEGTGSCSAARLLALIHKSIVNYQPDEVFIGWEDEEV